MEQIRFGVTKIFFRAGEMAKVEELRERIVGEMIIGVQVRFTVHLVDVSC